MTDWKIATPTIEEVLRLVEDLSAGRYDSCAMLVEKRQRLTDRHGSERATQIFGAAVKLSHASPFGIHHALDVVTDAVRGFADDAMPWSAESLVGALKTRPKPSDTQPALARYVTCHNRHERRKAHTLARREASRAWREMP